MKGHNKVTQNNVPWMWLMLLALATFKGALESLRFHGHFVGQDVDLDSASQTEGARETSCCVIL